MAMKVVCPNCGPRPFSEFWFGGEVVMQDVADPSDAEADFQRVWFRRNAYGLQREQWFHHAGCRRWHTTQRDTITNELSVID
jgi:heterotetrameric sarcosine oxidase delta subunit